ncbi:MAG: VENN motif pre-toxin domain-containing protein [Plesiomonas shigelloides]
MAQRRCSTIRISYLGAFGGNEEYQVALNKVLGGLAAAAVTGDENDFDTGADRAETVYRYNAMAHTLAALKARDPERFAKLMEAKQEQFKACGESPDCKNAAIAGFGLVGLPLLPSELLLAAGIGGGANTGFQLWANDGDFSKVDATEAVFAAYLSAGTAGWGFWSTVGANSAGGAYMSYLDGEDPLDGGIASGIGSSLGYGLGKLIEIPMSIKLNPNYKNYEWVDIGLGISKQPELSIAPSTTGNVFGSVFSEWMSKKTQENLENASNNKK